MGRESRFLLACQRKKVDCTPVWFMRQAGRYLPEYRRLREKYSMLEMVENPAIAAEVTLQPLYRFDLDAAIVFADILLPLPVIGVEFSFIEGVGPRIHQPLREPEGLDQIHTGNPESELAFVADTIAMVRGKISPGKAVIGFAGAPFTLASYIIEGGHSRNFLETKRFMYSRPDSWKDLMSRLTEVTISYLKMQIRAGAQAVQLFDSWVGTLSPLDYSRYVKPFTARIFTSLEDAGIPLIHFGTGTSGFLEEMRSAGGDVQSIDWRIPLGSAWEKIGFDTAIQGNLDPLAMFAPPEVLREKVREVLAEAGGRAGHIFNLGHGFLPQTPISNVELVVETVHESSRHGR